MGKRMVLWLSSLIILLPGCAWRHQPVMAGIADLVVGDPWPPQVLVEDEWRNMTVSDTVFVEGGYTWAGKVLEHTEGKIYVEADFFEGNEINRIRIQTPTWPAPQGLRVGMTWGDMRDRVRMSRWTGTLIPGYHVWDIVDKKYDRVHFLIPDHGFTRLSQIDKETKIQAIVWM